VIAIVAGFIAVVCQSVFYLAVRRAQVHLLIPGLTVNMQMHWQIGFVAWPVALMFWPEHLSWQGHLYLLGASAMYWVAQICLFTALKQVSSSQVAPLLALKLIVVGLGSTLFLNAELSDTQWQAVFLATLSAVFLSIGAQRPPLSATLLTLGTVTMFSLSDISLGAMINELDVPDIFNKTVFVLSYAYGINSLFTLPTRPWRLDQHAVKACVPLSLLCILTMIFLFTSFVVGGIVVGNLMLATRGLVTIVVIFALKSYLEAGVEPVVSPAVWMRRIVAATGMLISVSWYISG
jgi:hypothetical protein